MLAFARDGGIELPDDARVLMLAQLRVLGYVFNPVSFYWCYRPDGELACMVAELNNTFGERLPELLRGGVARATSTTSACTSRRSCRLDQRYGYAFSEPGERVCARIDVLEGGETPLSATLRGRRRELTNRTLGGRARPLPADAGAGDRRSSTGRR